MTSHDELIVNEQRFVDLYDEFGAAVYSYCRRRFPRSTSEDVAADVFATVWRRIEEVPVVRAEQLPWLYRVAYFTASNHRRSFSRRSSFQEKLRRRSDQASRQPDERSVAELVATRDEVRIVTRALTELKPSDQEILRLSVWEQLTAIEIGVALDITPEAAGQRLHRARKRLAAASNLDYSERPASGDTKGGRP